MPRGLKGQMRLVYVIGNAAQIVASLRQNSARLASGDRAGGSQREVGVMKHFRKIKMSSDPHSDVAVPKAGGFLDYVLEMYSPPDDVKLRMVPSGRAGIMQDRMRIRSYYKAAAEKAFGSKE
jgi:hypothetical protein